MSKNEAILIVCNKYNKVTQQKPCWFQMPVTIYLCVYSSKFWIKMETNNPMESHLEDTAEVNNANELRKSLKDNSP